jgi:hypothetical protein
MHVWVCLVVLIVVVAAAAAVWHHDAPCVMTAVFVPLELVVTVCVLWSGGFRSMSSSFASMCCSCCSMRAQAPVRAPRSLEPACAGSYAHRALPFVLRCRPVWGTGQMAVPGLCVCTLPLCV